MRSGFIVLNKPPTMTSSDAVVAVRRCFAKGTRVGHMGTLDPGACGVLPIGVGKAARLFDYVIDKDKEYLAEMKLGVATDTQDRFGSVTRRRDVRVSRSDLEAHARRFLGEIDQIPPAYSAVKKEGKRLYELARAGVSAQVPARKARIDAIDVLHFQGDRALLRVACGRGTYIRTLIDDLGEALGCGAHMSFLVRTRTGPFTIDAALSPERFRRAMEQGKPPLVSMDAPLTHLPALALGHGSAAQVRSGHPLDVRAAAGLSRVEDGPLRIYLGEAFAGIVRQEQGALRWKAMLLEEE